jgi:protein TonB
MLSDSRQARLLWKIREAAMFEDSTFESSGRIHTRSRDWMVAALSFNGSILLALIVIPLIYPEALPRQAFPFLMEVPAPPLTQPPPLQQPAHSVSSANASAPVTLFAQPTIHLGISQNIPPDAPPGGNFQDSDIGVGVGEGTRPVFQGHGANPQVRLAPNHKVRVSESIMGGWALFKPTPRYPAIAIAAHKEGTVVLAATISKVGTIEDLRVVSGPVLLQQAALDAVKTWRYRPYELDGQPVEVETTVNVVFTLGR